MLLIQMDQKEPLPKNILKTQLAVKIQFSSIQLAKWSLVTVKKEQQKPNRCSLRSCSPAFKCLTN